MNHEAQEGSEASRAGINGPQGRLSEQGGRAAAMARPPDSPVRRRLKRSVELFPAKDGSLYLLRLGAGDDLVIAEPTPTDRVLLNALRSGFRTPAELRLILESEGTDPAQLGASMTILEDADVIEFRRKDRLLDPAAAERYDRQLIYFADLAGPGQEAEAMQMRLAQARVALVGCGGLGSWVACGLASAGIGSLVLVDDDRVELSNLNRQLLFTEDQLCQLKVYAARDSLVAHNGNLEVVPVERRIKAPGDLDDVLAHEPDLVIVTADWPPHDLPRWVNQACLRAGVPWTGAGQFPPRIRVGPMVIPGRSACHECLERAVRREHPLYEELAAWRGRQHTPDASVGAVSGVIGSVLASEAIHLLIGAFQPASVGRVLLLDLATMTLTQEVIERESECPACGQRE